jgi:hypothetical protein
MRKPQAWQCGEQMVFLQRRLVLARFVLLSVLAMAMAQWLAQ